MLAPDAYTTARSTTSWTDALVGGLDDLVGLLMAQLVAERGAHREEARSSLGVGLSGRVLDRFWSFRLGLGLRQGRAPVIQYFSYEILTFGKAQGVVRHQGKASLVFLAGGSGPAIGQGREIGVEAIANLANRC